MNSPYKIIKTSSLSDQLILPCPHGSETGSLEHLAIGTGSTELTNLKLAAYANAVFQDNISTTPPAFGDTYSFLSFNESVVTKSVDVREAKTDPKSFFRSSNNPHSRLSCPVSVFQKSQFKREKEQKKELLHVNLDTSLDNQIIHDVQEHMPNIANVLNITHVPENGFPPIEIFSRGSRKPVIRKPGFDTFNEVESESLSILQNLSKIQRQEAETELTEMFGENLINKLRQRGLRKAGTGSNSGAILDPKKAVVCHSNKLLRIDFQNNEIISKPLVMTLNDTERLRWTEPVHSSEVAEESFKRCLVSLRFDLYGKVISASHMTQLENTELFHHGDAPAKPGYTINEIVDFWLCSTNASQRYTALQALISIMENRFERNYFEPESNKKKSCCSMHKHNITFQKKGMKLLAGYGFGLHEFERYMFEQKELHWKVFLSCRSSNVDVRRAAICALAAIFGPNGDGSESLEGAPPNLITSHACVQWANKYRSVLMNENAVQAWDLSKNKFSTFKESTSNEYLDESTDRLRRLFISNETTFANDNTMPGLSVNDLFIHLFFSGNRYYHQEDCWYTELTAIIENALRDFRRNPTITVSVLKLLCSMVMHSSSVAYYMILKSTGLVAQLQELMLTYTSGTSQHNKSVGTVSADDAKKIKSWFLHFLTLFGFSLSRHSALYSEKNLLKRLVNIFGASASCNVLTSFINESIAISSEFEDSLTECVRQQVITFVTMLQNENVYEIEEVESFYQIFLSWIKPLKKNQGRMISDKCKTLTSLTKFLSVYSDCKKNLKAVYVLPSVSLNVKTFLQIISLLREIWSFTVYTEISKTSLKNDLYAGMAHLFSTVLTSVETCWQLEKKKDPQEQCSTLHTNLAYARFLIEDITVDICKLFKDNIKKLEIVNHYQNKDFSFCEIFTHFMMDSRWFSPYIPYSDMNFQGFETIPQYLSSSNFLLEVYRLNNSLASTSNSKKNIMDLNEIESFCSNESDFLHYLASVLISIYRSVKCITAYQGLFILCGKLHVIRTMPLISSITDCLRQILSDLNLKRETETSPEDIDIKIALLIGSCTIKQAEYAIKLWEKKISTSIPQSCSDSFRTKVIQSASGVLNASSNELLSSNLMDTILQSLPFVLHQEDLTETFHIVAPIVYLMNPKCLSDNLSFPYLITATQILESLLECFSALHFESSASNFFDKIFFPPSNRKLLENQVIKEPMGSFTVSRLTQSLEKAMQICETVSEIQ